MIWGKRRKEQEKNAAAREEEENKKLMQMDTLYDEIDLEHERKEEVEHHEEAHGEAEEDGLIGRRDIMPTMLADYDADTESREPKPHPLDAEPTVMMEDH